MGENLFDLTGKTALVTGGSRGLGLAMARGLARHNATLVVLARNGDALVEAKSTIEREGPGAVYTVPCDLARPETIDGAFERAVDLAGPIDILVNSAGIQRRHPAEEIPIADWNAVLDVNLTGAFVMSQAFCRHRKAAGAGGKIVNIGSLMCRGARPTTAAYAATKGGLLMMTKSCAVEWARYGICVNAIGPGYFDTDMTKPLQQDENLNAWVLGRTPLGRWGRPDDLVGALVYLVAPASDFVTGQIIYVDGGWLAGL